MPNPLNTFKFNILLLSVVLLSIIFSFFLEYVLQVIPCKICIFQRYLWIILFFITFLNLKATIRNKKYIEIIILLNLGLIILLNFYHSGIEFGFFQNIISCISNSDIKVNSIEELDKLIRNTNNNDCAFPKFFIFGLSLSNLSFILSSLLFLLCLKYYKKNIFIKNDKKNKRNH